MEVDLGSNIPTGDGFYLLFMNTYHGEVYAKVCPFFCFWRAVNLILFSSRKSFQFMPLLQPISLQPIFLLLLLPLPFRKPLTLRNNGLSLLMVSIRMRRRRPRPQALKSSSDVVVYGQYFHFWRSIFTLYTRLMSLAFYFSRLYTGRFYDELHAIWWVTFGHWIVSSSWQFSGIVADCKGNTRCLRAYITWALVVPRHNRHKTWIWWR